MRRLLEKEKNLNIEIKKLQQEKLAESKEYQKEIAENQSRIQLFKENLMHEMETNKIKIEYRKKEAEAEYSNLRRMLDQDLKKHKATLEAHRAAIATEKLVHAELEEYLKSKNDEIKKKSEEITNKTDISKETFENETQELRNQIEKTNELLEDFKKKYQEEEDRKIAREKAERDKIMQKREKVPLV